MPRGSICHGIWFVDRVPLDPGSGNARGIERAGFGPEGVQMEIAAASNGRERPYHKVAAGFLGSQRMPDQVVEKQIRPEVNYGPRIGVVRVTNDRPLSPWLGLE
jgi:hypothetical protein